MLNLKHIETSERLNFSSLDEIAAAIKSSASTYVIPQFGTQERRFKITRMIAITCENIPKEGDKPITEPSKGYPNHLWRNLVDDCKGDAILLNIKILLQ
jgi:hypothetical protein